jgi:hypothetical protein
VFSDPAINNFAILAHRRLAAKKDEAWHLDGMTEDVRVLANGSRVYLVDRHSGLYFPSLFQSLI